MDPIDRIADVFAADCRANISKLQRTMRTVDTSATYGHAIRRLTRQGLFHDSLEEVLPTLNYEIQQFDSCLESMDTIKSLARRVLLINFTEGERFLTFNQEICFSFACKYETCIGPRLSHFTNASAITNHEIQRAEINIAKTSLHLLVGPDMMCYESM